MLAQKTQLRTHSISESDPEAQLRMELRIYDCTMERVFKGCWVEPSVITHAAARARIEMAMEPFQLAKLIKERIETHREVNLQAMQDLYPDAYKGYSFFIDLAMRKQAEQAEQGYRAEWTARMETIA